MWKAKTDYFRGKVALVTGGGSGIGRELALQLADLGARVIITDIVDERINDVLAELKRRSPESAGYRVDHADYESVKEFSERFFEDWDHVDILCSNAGVGAGGRIEELTLEDWQWMMNINLWNSIYMVQLFIPKMIQRKTGQILITSSGAGIIGIPGMAPYCTSKFAMLGLAESLRLELYRHNIKVSALCPGIIDTNIIRGGKIYFHDAPGTPAKEKVEKFYDRFGVHPKIVAKQAIRGMARDTGIIPSPLHMWGTYLLKRISPALYQGLVKRVWKTGWIF